MAGPRSVAVIGAGWAGLAAAVEALRRGHRVTLFDMAAQAGGRARTVPGDRAGAMLDNGQHILIGAYRDSLALLATVGVVAEQALLRTPLRLVDARGDGLALRRGAPVIAFVGAVGRQRRWTLRERAALLGAALGWSLRGFRCDPGLTVDELTRALPQAIRETLIDPLCIAALNTPARHASATVFLRVLKDALFGGTGSADLLLPRVDLSALLATPAVHWLRANGAIVHLGRRVHDIAGAGDAWTVDGARHDALILATTSVEAARLTRSSAPAWSAQAEGLQYEPIITVYLQGAATLRLDEAMLTLHSDADRPAQFVFDKGQLGGAAGLLAFVISGAAPWLERGMDATVRATLAQVRKQLAPGLADSLRLVRALCDRRATFRCTPALERPPAIIAAGLHAAGDYIRGPYPATLEGAVRSGIAAVAALG